MELVNCSPAAVCATCAFPVRNVLLTPKGMSDEENAKLPWDVLTSNVTGPVDADVVTINPFSWTGPGGLIAGVVRVDSFQLLVPVTASVSLNRQPLRSVMVAPVAVMDPSQFVGVLSPTPRI